MRNNPNHGHKLEYEQLFLEQARVEKIRRFFTTKRQKIFKHFTLQPFHSNFCKKNVDDYINSLDNFLQMKRKLVSAFKAEEQWPDVDPAEQVGFDHFYDRLAHWGTHQKELNYADFAAAEEASEAQSASTDFKRITDKLM